MGLGVLCIALESSVPAQSFLLTQSFDDPTPTREFVGGSVLMTAITYISVRSVKTRMGTTSARPTSLTR